MTLLSYAASVTISWNANEEPDIAAYRIYYGTSSNTYTDSLTVENPANPPQLFQHEIDGLTQGKTYYFSIQAIDEAGQVSDYAEEVTTSIPYGFDGDLADNLSNIEWLESGTVKINDSWTTITLNRNFENPVVIVSPPSGYDGEPCTVRVNNVTGNSFDVRIAEWNYLDGTHGDENISWMVVEAGVYGMPDGTIWQAGTYELSGTKSFISIDFPATFNTVPVVFQTVQTENGLDTISIREKDITETGFSAAMQEQESLNDGHVVETIGYLAVEKNIEGSHIIATISANHETFVPDGVPGTYCKLEEEQSRDDEMNHVNEQIGYMALGDLFFAQIQTYYGGDTSTMRATRADDSTLPADWYITESWIEVGTISLNHNWVTVELDKQFENPVVIAGPLTYNGHDPSVVRIQNVTPTSFEIRIQEWDYRDGAHITEQVSWMVIEAGTHTLPDGTVWQAGLYELDGTNQWLNVEFDNPVAVNPMLFQSIQTFNDESAVTTRLDDITATGFKAALQEQESLNDGHGIETVGYLAVPVTSPVNSGLVHLNSTFTGAGTSLVQILIEEEKSKDSETYHTYEDAAYMMLGDNFFSTLQTFNGPDTAALRMQ